MTDLPLPQLEQTTRRPHSSRGPLRATVLILVQLAIIAHFVHWRVAGDTLSPVEPSESSHALREGVINAGLVFFALALLATLIFGRFVCGWLCHLVALQDLCAWMLGKIGLRPKPFRSRLLLLAPLGLGLYLFVWQPLAPRLLDNAPLFPEHGIENRLITDDFWGTFPPLIIAIPFVIVCGFLTIYFLGAKGFCTYACPYGGFFAPLDRAAPIRIKVDRDKCTGSGHCTAVCTSNVRVHQEVADYGMVVDPGCMKCTDCISACPNDALSLGVARPPLFSKTPKPSSSPRWLSRGEDLVACGTFLAVFLATFRAYGPDLFPLLFAGGLAACAAPIGVATFNLFRKDNLRFVHFQLKRAGMWRPPGVALAIVSVALTLLVVHTGLVNLDRWRVDTGFRTLVEMGHPTEDFISPSPPQLTGQQRAALERAVAAGERIRPFTDGGIGLVMNERATGKAAVMRIALGDFARALDDLLTIDDRRKQEDRRSTTIARLFLAMSQPQEAFEYLTRTLDAHPEFWESREILVGAFARQRRLDEAIALTDEALAEMPERWTTREARARTHAQRAELLRLAGRSDEALEAAKAGAEADPDNLYAGELHAALLFQIGAHADAALAEMRRIARRHPEAIDTWTRLAQLASQTGHPDIARAAALHVNEKGSDEARRLIAPLLDQ